MVSLKTPCRVATTIIPRTEPEDWRSAWGSIRRNTVLALFGIFRLNVCQMECRIGVVYQACHDRSAALFLGTWAQKAFISTALVPLSNLNNGRLEKFNLHDCQPLINFDPNVFPLE